MSDDCTHPRFAVSTPMDAEGGWQHGQELLCRCLLCGKDFVRWAVRSNGCQAEEPGGYTYTVKAPTQ